MNRTLTILSTVLLAGCSASFAQVSQTTPQKWEREMPLTISYDIHHVKLSHNTPELIRAELLDTNTVRLVARFAGVTEKELASIQVAPGSIKEWVSIYQLGKSDRAFNILENQLRSCVEARQAGHTREFLLAALTNRVKLSAISDPDLRVLMAQRPMLPPSWLTKADSGTTTNQAGVLKGSTVAITVNDGELVTNESKHIPKMDEVCRWALYTATDGEIAWRYHLQFKADGSLDYLTESRCDAKELDPKYRDVIKAVDSEVETEMKQTGTYHKFGSVHTYWGLKKEKLKARGIEWRSPAELNPNVIFD